VVGHGGAADEQLRGDLLVGGTFARQPAISASCAVRVSGIATACRLACPPVARSSMCAGSANAAAPIESKISHARLS
jgi:hypothetical protein